jgi:hypothetical protein
MPFLKALVAVPYVAGAVVFRLLVGLIILAGAPVVGAVYFGVKWGLTLCVMNITYGLAEDFERIRTFVKS